MNLENDECLMARASPLLLPIPKPPKTTGRHDLFPFCRLVLVTDMSFPSKCSKLLGGANVFRQ